ncbi:SUF system NifU family Fe-S cluster assembly protein [Candidatus Woesearchaeota archaeon]|nr:SUF system NifU family Fe-S cluster assembly protein [Candidatus Woesearchaeota archaeon]
MSLDIYQENILDHYEHPQNFGHLKEHDAKAHDSNPLCGDSFDIELKFNGNKVCDVKFSGHGCAISTASASMLTENIKGKTIEDIKKLEKEDVLELLGIKLSHVRIKCAMLPLKIIKLCAYEYMDKHKK